MMHCHCCVAVGKIVYTACFNRGGNGNTHQDQANRSWPNKERKNTHHALTTVCLVPPVKIVFQEQSYFTFRSSWSLEWAHFHCIIPDPCGDWQSRSWRCGGWIVHAPMPIVAQLAKHKTL